MNSVQHVALATAALMFGSTPVWAEEVILIHRSGKIQTIQIDSSSDPVEQVSFRKTDRTGAVKMSPSQPAPVPATREIQPPKISVQPPAEQAKPAEKPGVKIKWAAPSDANY